MHISPFIAIALSICSSSALLLRPVLTLAQNAINGSNGLPYTPLRAASLDASRRQIVCKPTEYGKDLDADSCEGALSKMPSSSESQTYAPRTRKTPGGVGLPVRYLSDDGKCAIDLDQRRSSEAIAIGITTADTIREYTSRLLENCVSGPEKTGGTVADFSQFKQLLITVRKYESRVDCTPQEAEPPVPEHCEKALEGMLARMKTSFFISRTSPLRGHNYVTLPRSFEHPSSPATDMCHIDVTKKPGTPVTISNWFDIWAAGVEIQTMCVEHGMSGTLDYIGDNGGIKLSMHG